MPDQASSGTGPLAGDPPEPARRDRPPAAARVGGWLAWWVGLWSLWIMLDDSLATDELLAGAGAAAIGALVAEVVSFQAGTHLRMRAAWLGPALRLPGQVAGDLVTVYGALWRRMVRGEQPDSAFVTEPVRFGDDSPEGMTRRTLLIGGRSLAPNAFALGIDRDTDTMVVHELVTRRRGN